MIFQGSSYLLPAHGKGGARARKKISAAKKSARPSEGAAAGGFKGGIPPRPSELVSLKIGSDLVK